jgi:hypothetical protein
MRNKNGIWIGVAAVLVLAGGWWWMEQSTRPEKSGSAGPGEIRTVAEKPAIPTLGTESVSAGAASVLANPQGEAPGMAEAANGGESAAEGQAPAPLLTAGDILAEPYEDYVRVAKKLAALVLDPRAPMADREEALTHALNLSAGNEAEVLTPLATNPTLPDSLAETILSEALNRSLAYQADLYLAALGVRKTPEMQKMIRDHLAFLTGGEDLGADPKAWVEPLNTAKKSWAE